MSERLTVAIAGASGFVGHHLAEALRGAHKVVALSRSVRAEAEASLEWRACDLFSLSSTRTALQGANVAVYLVHSMMPSSRLFQGNFHDTDLLLADNFARACKHHGVKRIVYLGGLVPEGHISQHLESRREVEDVLASYNIPVTCLRAGMVVGAGGSSFEMLRRLVERLPAMVLPAWTQRRAQAIYIDDAVNVLRAAIVGEANLDGRTLNLINGESLSYEMLLRQTAKALGKKRAFFRVPISSTSFSKRWVELFANSSYELVSPLIDSLQCDMPAGDPPAEIAPWISLRTYDAMLRTVLGSRAQSSPQGAKPSVRRVANRAAMASTVRSIQRLPALSHHTARDISNEYMQWLPRFFWPIIRVVRVPERDTVEFRVPLLRRPLLVLELIANASDESRDKFHITGGLLSKTTDTGWLEFRQVAAKRFTLSAIHEFVPALPWFIYRITQALLHKCTMHAFGRHLKTFAEKTNT